MINKRKMILDGKYVKTNFKNFGQVLNFLYNQPYNKTLYDAGYHFRNSPSDFRFSELLHYVHINLNINEFYIYSDCNRLFLTDDIIHINNLKQLDIIKLFREEKLKRIMKS